MGQQTRRGTSGTPRYEHTTVIIETEEGTKTMKTIVTVRGLHKRYELGKDNFVDALRGATVNVGAGEMVWALSGSSCT